MQNYSMTLNKPSTQTHIVCEVANNERTHWRYAIAATRVLRTLIQRDAPTPARLMRLLLEKTHDDHNLVVRVLIFSLSSISLTHSCSAPCRRNLLVFPLITTDTFDFTVRTTGYYEELALYKASIILW
jgi:hypothetical protein